MLSNGLIIKTEELRKIETKRKNNNNEWENIVAGKLTRFSLENVGGLN